MVRASLDHICQVGRWNSEVMENNYLTCLLRQAMRIIYGFLQERGCFWLPRALVVPPLSLQRMRLPEFEDELQQLENDRYVHITCGESFLKLSGGTACYCSLRYSFLKMSNPEYPVFEREIFVCYEQYNAAYRGEDESCSTIYQW